MKKLLTAILISGVLLAGCGSDDKSEPPDPAPAADDGSNGDDPAAPPDGEDPEAPENGDDTEASTGSTGLGAVRDRIIVAGIPCDGEIEPDQGDSGVEPEPVEIFDCPQDDGLLILGVGWASADDANAGVTALAERFCSESIELTSLDDDDWMVTIMEVTPETEDAADELLADIGEAIGDIPTTRDCP